MGPVEPGSRLEYEATTGETRRSKGQGQGLESVMGFRTERPCLFHVMILS